MADTPISLLERLRMGADAASWPRLVDLYTPLIRRWLAPYRVQPSDVDDLTQEVFGAVLQELPSFRHNLQRGAFRRWLRTIAVNRLRVLWRTRREFQGDAAFLDQLEDPASDLHRAWDEEHDRYVARRLLELLEPEFEPTTWAAFRFLVLEGLDTQDVAARVGLTPNAVRIAKSRVLSRLRREIDGLID